MKQEDEYRRLRAAGVPEGYATRMVLSHHLGGWAKCEGLPKCQWCVKDRRRTAWNAARRRIAA